MEWARASSEVVRAECAGEEDVELDFLEEISVLISNDQRQVWGEFIEDLAAAAAGERLVGCGNRQGTEPGVSFRDSFEHGGTFGAIGQAVGGILHVATDKCFPGVCQQCGTHLVVGVGRVSKFPGLRGF